MGRSRWGENLKGYSWLRRSPLRIWLSRGVKFTRNTLAFALSLGRHIHTCYTSFPSYTLCFSPTGQSSCTIHCTRDPDAHASLFRAARRSIPGELSTRTRIRHAALMDIRVSTSFTELTYFLSTSPHMPSLSYANCTTLHFTWTFPNALYPRRSSFLVLSSFFGSPQRFSFFFSACDDTFTYSFHLLFKSLHLPP